MSLLGIILTVLGVVGILISGFTPYSELTLLLSLILIGAGVGPYLFGWDLTDDIMSQLRKIQRIKFTGRKKDE